MKRPVPKFPLPASGEGITTAVLGILLGGALAVGAVMVLDRKESVSVEAYTKAKEELESLEEENADLLEEIDLLVQSAEENPELASAASKRRRHTRANVETSFNARAQRPKVSASAYIDPEASVIGAVELGKRVYVAPNASIRADEGQPFHLGDETNVQDGVTLHALETSENGKPIASNLVEVGGKKWAIWIGDRVSLAHDALVHGPAVIGNNTFVGMKAFVFRAVVGPNVVIEPGALVMGVTIKEGRYVPAGEVVTSQDDADDLPEITEEYAFKDLNDGVLHVNVQLADAYNGRNAQAELVSDTGHAGKGDKAAGGSDESEDDGHGDDGGDHADEEEPVEGEEVDAEHSEDGASEEHAEEAPSEDDHAMDGKAEDGKAEDPHAEESADAGHGG